MNTRIAVYLAGEQGPDESIIRGLQQSECEVLDVRTVREAFDKVRILTAKEPQPLIIIIAEVGAGAIPFLMLIDDLLSLLPPTLLFDRKGDDIHSVVKALQLGVHEYLLAVDPEMNRELSARLLVERANAELDGGTDDSPIIDEEVPVDSKAQATNMPVGFDDQFQWDPIGHVLHFGDSYVRMSPIEGRIFDLLLTNHNRTVPMEELVRHVLTNPNVDVESGVKQLRPHIVRLRRKLEQYPTLSNRILNMRGAGYMFI
jgi:DNA-binding response OmpR family regulator